jgi:hypothetical protein
MCLLTGRSISSGRTRYVVLTKSVLNQLVTQPIIGHSLLVLEGRRPTWTLAKRMPWRAQDTMFSQRWSSNSTPQRMLSFSMGNTRRPARNSHRTNARLLSSPPSTIRRQDEEFMDALGERDGRPYVCDDYAAPDIMCAYL